MTVKIDNLCPRQGNSMCSQQTTADVNQVGEWAPASSVKDEQRAKGEDLGQKLTILNDDRRSCKFRSLYRFRRC